MPDQTTDFDAMADRFVQTCADTWMVRQLPVVPLAAAFATWGLQMSSHVEGPEETAAGLERIAAQVREAGRRVEEAERPAGDPIPQ
ncbi:MAG: hypothetical protein ACYDD1_22700 [Caulobacteraceae bacterium]